MAHPGGRPPNTPNRSTQRQRELFAPYIPQAIKVLMEIAGISEEGGEPKKVSTRDIDRIAAVKLICEYGLGKPIQQVEGPGDDGTHVHKVLVEFTDKLEEFIEKTDTDKLEEFIEKTDAPPHE